MTMYEPNLWIWPVLAICVSPLAVAAIPSDETRVSLELAGGNRAELEAAMLKIPGKGTEYLITHASPYDLANLTSKQIVENVTYARKVHVALPYLGEKLDDDIWREWVLPNRVLEEELSLWRKSLYETIYPLVQDKSSCKEVAEAVSNWLKEEETGLNRHGVPGRIRVGASENRPKDPLLLLEKEEGACREFNILFVSCMRAIGIPARHVVGSWWYSRKARHYFTEYWDPKEKRWVLFNPTDYFPSIKEQIDFGKFNALAYYAYPSFPQRSDPYGRDDWKACINVTDQVTDVYEIRTKVADGSVGDPVALSVWNSGAWRCVVYGQTGGIADPLSASVRVAKGKEIEKPVLLSRVHKGVLNCAFGLPRENSPAIELRNINEGEWIQWPPKNQPKEIQ